MIVDILNILVILLYVATVLHMYNHHTDYFISMLIVLVYWAQLLVSSAYIETGVYLKDIGTTSYATGVTVRLFLMIEILLFTIMYFAGRWRKKVRNTAEDIESVYNCTGWNRLLIILYAYRLLDILVSGNILTNSEVTRFNYFSDFSKLPFAQVVDYFSYPMLWVVGYNFVHAGTKRQKCTAVLILLMNVASLFLRGIQFGGYLQCTIYFLSPLLLKLAKKRKLLRFRYIALATVLVVVMLIPKYNYFAEAIKENRADTSYGMTTAYEFLMYRMLAQEADLTWEIDRQVIEQGEIDPGQYLNELASIIGIPVESETGPHYLMERGCSSSALVIYSRGAALVTGGYPMIYPSMFGYMISFPFLIFDGFLIALLCRCICQSLKEKRLVRLIMSGYVFCQCYTIVISADLSSVGNIIPKIFIVMLILTANKKLVLNSKLKGFYI